MANFFQKQVYYPLPDSYQDVISEHDYNLMITKVVDYFNEKDIKINDINDKEFVLQFFEYQQDLYLAPLVGLVKSAPENWQDLMEQSLEGFLKEQTKLNLFHKDFEFAKPHIRVLTSDKRFTAEDLKNVISREYFPNVLSILIIEVEGKVTMLKQDFISEWKKELDELYFIGIQNILQNKTEVNQYTFADKYNVFVFFSAESHSYCPSLMLDLKGQVPEAIGELGSLIAIPCTVNTCAYPIKKGDDIVELIEHISPIIQKEFKADKIARVSPLFYWMYNDRIEVFPYEIEDKTIRFLLPEQLKELLYK